jgi:hypothetical protein
MPLFSDLAMALVGLSMLAVKDGLVLERPFALSIAGQSSTETILFVDTLPLLLK